jgi:acetoin utilization deacetylase AcuC-like enzyme
MHKTGYFSHPACRKHEMGAGHPECPERLDAINDWLLATGVLDALEQHQAPAAPIADLELAHGRMHIAALRGLTDGLREERLRPVAPPTRRLTPTPTSTSTPGTPPCTPQAPHWPLPTR